jgi:hypothetical protein
MRNVLISVEGQTEETFVAEVLRPHFTGLGLFLIPILVKTRHLPGRPADRGGYLTYPKVKRELLSLLGDTSAVAVTTMYDFYKLPDSFPGHSSLPEGNGCQRVQHLEMHLREDIDDPRFRPYLQLHEFEALLFVDIQKTTEWLLGDDQQINRLHRIGQAFSTPEEIDEGEQTAPSKRLKRIFPTYEKEADGPLIALDIGLSPLREACRHFDEWITWLEHVAAES